MSDAEQDRVHRDQSDLQRPCPRAWYTQRKISTQHVQQHGAIHQWHQTVMLKTKTHQLIQASLLHAGQYRQSCTDQPQQCHCPSQHQKHCIHSAFNPLKKYSDVAKRTPKAAQKVQHPPRYPPATSSRYRVPTGCSARIAPSPPHNSSVTTAPAPPKPHASISR